MIQFILAIAIALLSFVAGYVLTETRYSLSRWRVFDMRPFNCRLCLSTHLTWVSETAAALAFGSVPMGAFGLACAAGVYYAIRYDTRKRTIKIEDEEQI